MTLEQLIEQHRIKSGTVESSLQAAQKRMNQTNERLSKLWKDGIVTKELLDKTISL